MELVILLIVYFILRAILFYYSNKLQIGFLNKDFIKKADQLNKNLKDFNKKNEKNSNDYIG
ncbi:MAG: hypothetical protein AABY22_34085 [Nanoarchaeota archaeon]